MKCETQLLAYSTMQVIVDFSEIHLDSADEALDD